MAARLSGLLLPLAALAGRAAAQDVVSAVTVDGDLETRVLVRDVYGYSVEPVWVDDYVATPLAANLLEAIGNVTGKPPPIRVGGNTADQTYLFASLPTGNDSVASPSPATATTFNITPAWFETWADYFPEGTDLIYTLNFAGNTSAWANAVVQARAAHEALGSKMTMFELGNEIDHFINKGWRGASWGVAEYIDQFRNLTGQIVASDWYQALAKPPKIQAGVFADPPWVHDQHDEIDDFSIANLTGYGAGNITERRADKDIIGSYAVHLYPQSTCDSERWHRMRLDLLSNHSVLWQNVSQYAPQVAAADRAGAPLIMGETNSVSCSGKSGISDTFGAALWTVDYVLMGAALGIQKTYFHLGARSEYSAFTPRAYALKNETLAPGIRPNWYSHYFVARVAARAPDTSLNVAALGGAANASDLAGYAVFTGAGRQALQKLVFLDMAVWNGTKGLANPSTLRATDGADFSAGERPSRTLALDTPWCAGRRARVTRLLGPGTNAKSGVSVSGLTFDARTGARVGAEEFEDVEVGEGGRFNVTMRRAEAVLLEMDKTSDCHPPIEKSAARHEGAPVGVFIGAVAAGLLLL